MGSWLYAGVYKMNKVQVINALHDTLVAFGAKTHEYVVIGHEAVFGLHEIDKSGQAVVIGVSGRLYADIRKLHREVSGYDGTSIPLDNKVFVKEGLPLSSELVAGVPCITLESLHNRLRVLKNPAAAVLDKHFAELNSKRQAVEAKYRVPYLSVDDQLLYQAICQQRNRQVTAEEGFVYDKLTNVDWSHQMSDCSSTWRAGENHRARLREDIANCFEGEPEVIERLTKITEFGYNGYEKLLKMYPWLEGFNASKYEQRGLLRAAIDGVTPEYITELRVIARQLIVAMENFPYFTYPMYYVATTDTPKGTKMREIARAGEPAYYGIAVSDLARRTMQEALDGLSKQKLKDICLYNLISGGWFEATENQHFKGIHDVRVSVPGKMFLFMKRF